MKNYLLHLGIIVLVTVNAVSCSQKAAGTYWIDNPTGEQIVVSVDDTEYTIPPTSGLDVEIEYGKHTLKYGDQSITVFVKSSVDKKVIINPTQSNFINYSQLYVVDGTDDETFESFYEHFIKINGDSIDIKIEGDTVRVFAPIKVYNGLFIEHTQNSWEYGLDEDLADNATIFSDTGEHFQTSRKKIFREKDFWDFFNDGALKDSDVEIIIEKTAYKDLPRFNPVPENLAKVQGEKYQQFLQAYVDSYYEWFDKTGKETLGGPKPFDVVKEDSEFNKLKLEYRELYPNDPSFTDACYEYFNAHVPVLHRFNFLIID